MFFYRGYFENRITAVKRVPPNSYKISEREVRLLQASDVHDNVVRYFCTEQCREFRYISLELCDATLDDYVQCRLPECPPSHDLNKAVMVQAVRGLRHLHKLNIGEGCHLFPDCFFLSHFYYTVNEFVYSLCTSFVYLSYILASIS